MSIVDTHINTRKQYSNMREAVGSNWQHYLLIGLVTASVVIGGVQYYLASKDEKPIYISQKPPAKNVLPTIPQSLRTIFLEDPNVSDAFYHKLYAQEKEFQDFTATPVMCVKIGELAKDVTDVPRPNYLSGNGTEWSKEACERLSDELSSGKENISYDISIPDSDLLKRSFDKLFGKIIADIGVADGCHGHHLAKRVGKYGRVYLTELDPNWSKFLVHRFLVENKHYENADNITIIQGLPDNICLPRNSIDIIRINNVHSNVNQLADRFTYNNHGMIVEINSLTEYMDRVYKPWWQSIANSLTRDGVVYVVDNYIEEDEKAKSIPRNLKLYLNEVEREIISATGLHVKEKKEHIDKDHWLLVFKKI